METKIITPRIGVNDDLVTIGSWLVSNGDYVEEGQELASLETTKETESLYAPVSGYLFYSVEDGEESKVGDVLAVVSDSSDYQFVTNTPDSSETFDDRFTEKAKALIEENHLELSLFSNMSLVREKDVKAFLSSSATTTSVKPSLNNQLIIVSGGGFAKMCIDIIHQTPAYQVKGILDPNLSPETTVLGEKVLGDDLLLESLYAQGFRFAVNGIGSIAGDNSSTQFFLRQKMFEKLKSMGFILPTLVHPSAVVSSSAMLGEGAVVMENAVIGVDAAIGDNCIINTASVISHDCKIGSHTRISPGAILAGDVSIGENSLIGMGVTVYLGVSIGKNVIISNGMHIFNDIPDGAVVR